MGRLAVRRTEVEVSVSEYRETRAVPALPARGVGAPRAAGCGWLLLVLGVCATTSQRGLDEAGERHIHTMLMSRSEPRVGEQLTNRSIPLMRVPL